MVLIVWFLCWVRATFLLAIAVSERECRVMLCGEVSYAKRVGDDPDGHCANTMRQAAQQAYWTEASVI
jgi:hypothetical protein